MTRDTDVAWAAGLFEGEGYFANRGTYSFAMQISSTDLDVLERFQKIAGGTVTPLPVRQAHHKPAWRWDRYGSAAIGFLREIRPYLLARRGLRADEILARFESAQSARDEKKEIRQEILRLWSEGTHSEREIGEMTGTNRSYVNAVRMGKMKV